VVEDEYLAEQVLAVARKGNFRVASETPALEELNAQRERAHMLPLSEEGRQRKVQRIEAMQKEMLDLIRDRDEAQRALDAAREAMAIELHARRTILRHLPRELAVRKIFEQYVPRYVGRHGGYTRVTKLGFRQGDAAHMARLEMI